MMYDELWSKDSFERLDAIDSLKLYEFDDICTFYRRCGSCPLAVLYHDAWGYERLLCVDVATRRRVINALNEGGRFLKKGEKLGET